MSNLMILRLLSSEDVLGDVEETDSSYKIKNPMILAAVPVADNRVKFVPQPYLIFSEENECEIPKSFVVHATGPKVELRNLWEQIHGSGLITPSANKIITPDIKVEKK